MSIEVGNLVVYQEVWNRVNNTCIVNSVSPSTIKFYNIEAEWTKYYLDTKKDFIENGLLSEDEDGNEIYIKFDEEDENEPYLDTIVSRFIGCPGYEDDREFQNTDKWDFLGEEYLTEHFHRPTWKHLEFKLVHTQLIKMTNLKTLEQVTYQYFKDENGKSYYINQHDGHDCEWSGPYIDNERAVFTTNDDCWEVASSVNSIHEDCDFELNIL